LALLDEVHGRAIAEDHDLIAIYSGAVSAAAQFMQKCVAADNALDITEFAAQHASLSRGART